LSCYQFDTGAIPTCGKTAGAYYRIEITTQGIAAADWVGGLSAPDWSSPIVRRSPFTFSDITIEGPPDAGQMSLGDVNFEAHNRPLEDGAGAITTDTIRSILALDTIDKNATAIHIRIGYKATSGGTFVWKFWGVLQWDSLECMYVALDDPTTWIYKFSAADSIIQLDTRDFYSFASDLFLGTSYHYNTAALYVDFIGTATGYKAAGRHAVGKLIYSESNASGGTTASGYNVDEARYVNIAEMIQAFSDYLGLGTSAYGFSTLSHWKYGINTATGGTTMTWVDANQLYIHAGIFNTIYKNEGTFFDYTTDCAHSFFRMASSLDVLKKVCQSLGYVARVTIDGSGNRQLTVVPATSASDSLTVSQANVAGPVTLKPYARSLAGAQATVPSGTNVVRGSAGNKTVNIDCIFSSCNNVRTSLPFLETSRMDLGPDRVTALYVSTDTPTGTRTTTPGSCLTVATMYSVCAIALYDGSSPVPSAAKIDPWGKYQSSAPFALNTVMYPSDDAPYNCWVEVPGMALAHSLYSDRVGAADISIYRDKGQELQIGVKGITAAIYYPGDILNVTIGGVAADWYVKSYREVQKSDKMEFIAERFV